MCCRGDIYGALCCGSDKSAPYKSARRALNIKSGLEREGRNGKEEDGIYHSYEQGIG